MIKYDPKSAHAARLGFTLLEMVVIVVLIGILTTLATTSWKRINYRMKVVGAVDELRNAFQLARSDAMTRRRASGIVLDMQGKRFLRFVDSATTGVVGMQDGLYTPSSDPILQNWTELPGSVVLYDVTSSISPSEAPRPCGQSAPASSVTVQSGMYSVVFRSDGSSVAAFAAKLGVNSFDKDTFRLNVYPANGFVTMEK